jgi:hypothetical protein
MARIRNSGAYEQRKSASSTIRSLAVACAFSVGFIASIVESVPPGFVWRAGSVAVAALGRLDLPAAPLGLSEDRLQDQQRATQLVARDVQVRDASAGPQLEAAGLVGLDSGERVAGRYDEPWGRSAPAPESRFRARRILAPAA